MFVSQITKKNSFGLFVCMPPSELQITNEHNIAFCKCVIEWHKEKCLRARWGGRINCENLTGCFLSVSRVKSTKYKRLVGVMFLLYIFFIPTGIIRP